MSDVEHGLRCHSTRLEGLKLFWMSRGHSAEEAHDCATRHLQGENVGINPLTTEQEGEIRKSLESTAT